MSKLEWTYICPRQMVGVKLNWLPRVFFFKGEDDCNRFSRVKNVIRNEIFSENERI